MSCPVPVPFSPEPVISQASQIPEPVVQKESAYRGMGSDVEQWRPLVAGQFEPEDVDRVLCLMSYESGGNPNSKNPHSTARGLMQVMASVWAPHFGISYDDLYDPSVNLYVARQIRDSQGWTAWSPFNRGLCH